MSLPVFSENTIRSLSTPASFLKGKKYFYDDAVGVVETDGDRYWSKVQGKRPYRVTIYKRNSELHAECTCHYNFVGICKHAVATMLKILHEGSKWNKERELSPVDMVKKMSKSELEDFVVDLIGLKEGILDFLRSYYLGSGRNALSTEDYLRQVEAIFSDDNLSLYDNRNVFENLRPIESLAEKLKIQGNYREAAKIFEALFEGVARNLNKVEDSYGLFAEIAGYSLENLTDCLVKEGIQEDQRHHYIQKFWEAYEHTCYQFFNDNYKAAIMALATLSDLEGIIEKLDHLIDEYTHSDNYGWLLKDHYIQAVTFKLDILEKLGRHSEFLRVARENCDISDICLKLTKKLKKDGKIDAAIDIAERNSITFNDLEAEGLNRFLAESYEETGKLSRAANKYKEMFLSLGVFEYYEHLRRLTGNSDTWGQVFSSIVQGVGSKHGNRFELLSEIYLRENMHEDAIRIAEFSSDLTVLEMVAEGVKNSHPAASYRLYKQLVDIYLDENRGRDAYQQAVSFLARMKEIGLDSDFISYVNELSTRFRRRRALLEEMSALSA